MSAAGVAIAPRRAPSWWLPGRAVADRARARAASDRHPARSAMTQPAADEAIEDEAALVGRVLAGEGDAYRVLVDRYQQRAFFVARGMLGNDEDARDAAQEAFVRAYRSLDRFDTRMRFYTWLYQIVVNLCIDQLRRQQKRRAASLDAVAEVGVRGQDSGRLEEEELRARVQQVLDELPPKYKAVMVLSDLEGIGAKEIAHMTGTTHATVRWRHHRARKLFRDAWERLFGKGNHVVR